MLIFRRVLKKDIICDANKKKKIWNETEQEVVEYIACNVKQSLSLCAKFWYRIVGALIPYKDKETTKISYLFDFSDLDPGYELVPDTTRIFHVNQLMSGSAE